ncbi:MAG: energy-coupling factor ABC transporter ATP-binding protein [Bacteroidales bacterium]|jgi:cobalt/nickel transport system ATP-binding protein
MPSRIKIEDLSYSYKPGREVLKDIRLEIDAGEKFGIIGPMGAGKSTLLLHLNGILTGKGRVMIDNLEVCKRNLPVIRKKVGIVFQNPEDQLFNPTVEEDVAFGPLNFGFRKEEARSMIDQALDEMNLKGYENRISHHLSMGEKKRVAIATVLAIRPEVIAFDEPFTSLDPTMINQMVDIIKALKSTVVIVSQSFLPLVACCERIAVMNNGKITAVGPTLSILKNESLLLENGIDLSLYRMICRELFL